MTRPPLYTPDEARSVFGCVIEGAAYALGAALVLLLWPVIADALSSL